jgi:hypothetical protein
MSGPLILRKTKYFWNYSDNIFLIEEIGETE